MHLLRYGWRTARKQKTSKTSGQQAQSVSEPRHMVKKCKEVNRLKAAGTLVHRHSYKAYKVCEHQVFGSPAEWKQHSTVTTPTRRQRLQDHIGHTLPFLR